MNDKEHHMPEPTARLLDCGLCYEENGEEVHPHPECRAISAVQQLNADGTWTRSVPIPLSDDLDFEVTGNGPFEWEALRGMELVATGSARTRLGLQVALLRARRKHSN